MQSVIWQKTGIFRTVFTVSTMQQSWYISKASFVTLLFILARNFVSHVSGRTLAEGARRYSVGEDIWP